MPAPPFRTLNPATHRDPAAAVALLLLAGLGGCGGDAPPPSPPPPQITQQPADVNLSTLPAGTAPQFSVQATGQGTLRYQWFRGGVALRDGEASGVRTPTVTLPAADFSNFTGWAQQQAGEYTVTVTDDRGQRTLAAARALAAPLSVPLSVTGLHPRFATGEQVSVRLQVFPGYPAASATWLKDGQPVPIAANPAPRAGLTELTLALGSAQVADAGVYAVRLDNGVPNRSGATDIQVSLGRLNVVQLGAVRPCADATATRHCWVDPVLNEGISVTRMHSTTAGEFWLAGSLGTVLRSTDGGRQWQVLTTRIAGTLTAVLPLGGGRLLALVEDGRILRSVDNGQQWTEVHDGAGGDWSGLDSPDGQRVLAVGRGGVLLSTDGGLRWQASAGAIDLNRGAPSAVRFAQGGQTAMLLRQGEVWRSDDGGLSWRRLHRVVPPAHTPAGSLVAADLTDLSIGPNGRLVLVGQFYRSDPESPSSELGPLVLQSDDDGASWQPAVVQGHAWEPAVTRVSESGNGQHLLMSSTVFEAGVGPVLRAYRSTDAGRHWTQTAASAALAGCARGVDVFQDRVATVVHRLEPLSQPQRFAAGTASLVIREADLGAQACP